jgi:hypothetical protein
MQVPAFLAWARRRLASDERGSLLIEYLVAISILVVVSGALLGLLEMTAKVAPRDQERAHAVREAQVGVHQMTRELRQAYQVLSSSSQHLDVLVRLPKDAPDTALVESHSTWHVLYTCGGTGSAPGKCVRYEARPGAVMPSTGETVIDRVLNWSPALPSAEGVFDYSESENRFRPSYVRVRIEVPAAGERTEGYRYRTELEDGFHVRNLGPGT